MSGISNYEKQYIGILRNIYENGFADGVNERTGYATKRIPGAVIQVDLEEEFPILKSKQVFGKTALQEILWIWQCQSNNINDLKAHIWDEWADHNGAIGAAYGAQVRKPVCIFTDPIHKTSESFRAYKNQAEYIIEYLREFPNGRWGNATLWSVDDLAKMNLVPCCHTATWNLDGGRLNCVLDQRSGDMPKGVPFNTTQYAQLTILFARDLGVKPGLLTHVIADAHIYDNQMEGVKEQLAYYDLLYRSEKNLDINCALRVANKYNEFSQENSEKALECTPTFFVHDDAPTDFFKVKVEDCEIRDYFNMGKVEFGETAV